MALFLSTYVNRVDKKGRVSVPASFRAALSGQNFNGIVAFRSYRLPAIEGMDMGRMEEISASTDNFALFSDEHEDLAAVIFADAAQLPFDGEGRIMLPEALAAHAGIDGEAAFVGRGRTFQIWEPAAFKAHQDEARRRAKEARMTVPLGRPAGGGEAR